MRLSSDAFDNEATIPDRHAGEKCGAGDNLSPPLTWTAAPDGTGSFVLLVEDPDAPIQGSFVHWVVYDVPGDATGLPEGSSGGGGPAFKQGRNDYRLDRYDGPCPPKGENHRYFFQLHALDVPELGLGPGATIDQVREAMDGHVLAQEQLMGRYGR